MLPKISPLAPLKRPTPFDDPAWLFEVKFDGFRALAYVEGGRCELISRKGNTYRRFQQLRLDLAAELGADAVLDGEVVCLDEDGSSRFEDLMLRRREPYFYAFDVLWLNGEDLRDQPLVERKARLRELVPEPPAALLYLDHIEEYGVDLFDLCCGLDLEGVVAKPKASPYRVLPNGDVPWIKIKNPDYSQAVGRADLFNARRS